MGLHVTPFGTFYVQRSLRTGEVMQVLPVRRPETPSHLPSVDSLGITENFIERRRASIAADQARASHSQDHLQRELAGVGGERLLETGMAVLAQQGDGDGEMQDGGGSSSSSSSSRHGKHKHNKGTGDSRHAGTSSAAVPMAPPPVPPASFHPASRHGSTSGGSSSHRGHYSNSLNDQSYHPEMVMSPSPSATVPQVLPAHPWSDAEKQKDTVNLPPFREIDTARVLSQDDRHSLRATSNTSRSASTSSRGSRGSRESGSSFSSVGSLSSTSSTSTAIFSPLPDGCRSLGSNSSRSSGGGNEVLAPLAPSSTPLHYQHHHNQNHHRHQGTPRLYE